MEYLVILSATLMALIALYLLKFTSGPQINKKVYQDGLSAIKLNLEAGQYQMVVMDCDKLMDKALIDFKLKGSTMGQRLKNAKNLSFNLNQVWQVHKLRNQIAHEVGFQVSKKDAENALSLTRANLKKLGLV
jgi:hypothetical protein